LAPGQQKACGLPGPAIRLEFRPDDLVTGEPGGLGV